ncbi:interleukin-8 [Trachinotus anak]|uniref:interleukin-8 n=1 Tax=Trachinotus anak TaxID=443729 RepID=UPI0039F1FE67
MMPKPLLVLAALTLCCCITTLHASSRSGCKCIRTTSQAIPLQAIKKIEVLPITGRCRYTEIIVTVKNNFRVCVEPSVTWINRVLSNLQKKKEAANAATQSPTASTLDF